MTCPSPIFDILPVRSTSATYARTLAAWCATFRGFRTSLIYDMLTLLSVTSYGHVSLPDGSATLSRSLSTLRASSQPRCPARRDVTLLSVTSSCDSLAEITLLGSRVSAFGFNSRWVPPPLVTPATALVAAQTLAIPFFRGS